MQDVTKRTPPVKPRMYECLYVHPGQSVGGIAPLRTDNDRFIDGPVNV